MSIAVGGVASTGMFEGKIQNVIDLVPDKIHAKCPIIMGSKRDVQIVYDKYKAAGFDVPTL
jgi:fructose-1,6-bisphosphatase I